MEEESQGIYDLLDRSVLWEGLKFISLSILVILRKFLNLFLRKEPKSLKGEVILVTGSANGLGKEMCRELASSGAILVLWDVQSQENARVAEELRDLGAKRVIHQTVDVSDREKVREAAMKIRHEVGPVTLLVNNAGMAPMQPFFETRADTIKKTFAVNVLSQFWTLQEFLPDMIKTNKGHIVTICSTMGRDPIRGCPPYVSSKHATHGLVECIKDEMAHLGNCDNIKFTTIYPFFMKTKLVDESATGLRLKFRVPWLTPFLEVEHVAKRVVRAIVYEEERLFMPKGFLLYDFIIPFLPTEVHILWVNFIIKEFGFVTPANDRSMKLASMKKTINGNTEDSDALQIDNKEATSKSF